MKKTLSVLLILMFFGKSFGQSDNRNQKEKNADSGSVNNTKISEGASGVKRSISYRFNSSPEDSDPGNGQFNFDKNNVSQTRYLLADDVDLSGEDQSRWFSTWDDTTGATGRGQIILVDQQTDKTTILDVTGVFSREKGYWKIPVSVISGGLPENGKVYFYIFNRIAKKKENEIIVPSPQTVVIETGNAKQPEPTADKETESLPVIAVNSLQPPQTEVAQPVVQSKPVVEEVPVNVVTSQPQIPEEEKPEQIEVPSAEPEQKPQNNAIVQPQVPEDKALLPGVPAAKPETEPAGIPSVTPQLQAPVQDPVQPVASAVQEQTQAVNEEVVTVQEKKEETVEVTKPVTNGELSTENRVPEKRPVPVPEEKLPVKEDSRRPADRSGTVNQSIEERVTQVSTVRQPATRTTAQPATQPEEPARQSTAQPSPVNRTATAQPVTETKTVNPEQKVSAQSSNTVQPVGPRITSRASSVSEQSSENSSAPPAYQSNLPVYKPVVNPNATGRGHGKCYSGIIEAGYGFGMGEYGMDNFRFNFINGFHIGPTFTVGLGLGVRKYFPESYSDRNLYTGTRMPVFLDLRKRFSTRTVTPYLAFGVGNSISFMKDQDSTRAVNDGLMINASGGIWLNVSQRFGVFAGIGYESEQFEYVWISDDSHFRKKGGSVSLNIGISF